jgi:MFS family permease
MVRTLLIRGMLLGVLAGLLAAAFAYVFGEPSVDWAIAFEEHSKAAEAMAEPELVSRGVQSTIGLLTGTLAIGTAIGGIFGIAYAFALGRLGRLSPAATALALAFAGFLVIALVPQLKYPANPPAVGSPETINARTGLYFAMLGLSVAYALVGLAVGRAIARSRGTWAGVLGGLAVYGVAVSVTMGAMPSINEVPEGFSAAVLWNFRLASLGIGAVLWGTLGLGFGSLAEWRPLPAWRRGTA